jgi:hypothetical protein
VFVDVHESDVEAARPLFAMLDALDVPYVLTTGTHVRLAASTSSATSAPASTSRWVGAEAADVLGEFQSLVRRVPLTIVAVGHASADWLMGRLREARKAGAQCETPTVLAVLRLPGNDGVPALPSFVRVFDGAEGIGEQIVRDLLAARTA